MLNYNGASTSLFIQNVAEILTKRSHSHLPMIKQVQSPNEKKLSNFNLKKLSIKQKVLNDVRDLLPETHRQKNNQFGSVFKRRHQSVIPNESKDFGLNINSTRDISFHDFTLKPSRKEINSYEESQRSLDVKRVQKIKNFTLNSNQYDIRNYMKSKSPLTRHLNPDQTTDRFSMFDQQNELY